jgi:hypothetical protein
VQAVTGHLERELPIAEMGGDVIWSKWSIG